MEEIEKKAREYADTILEYGSWSQDIYEMLVNAYIAGAKYNGWKQ